MSLNNPRICRTFLHLTTEEFVVFQSSREAILLELYQKLEIEKLTLANLRNFVGDHTFIINAAFISFRQVITANLFKTEQREPNLFDYWRQPCQVGRFANLVELGPCFRKETHLERNWQIIRSSNLISKHFSQFSNVYTNCLGHTNSQN